MHPRRHFVRQLLASALVALPLLAGAQAWPTKPITLVVPFPPGNTADLVARALQEPLRQALGQVVVVDNRPGAGGNLALQAVARATDGHTLLVTTGSPLVINPALYKNPGFDAERDFVPVAIVGSIPMVLIARNDLPVNSLDGLVRYLRANESTVNFASVGQGTFTHLGMELFSRSLGLKLTHVPYKGASAAHTDLIGSRVDLMFDSVASSNVLLKAGRVKPLAVSSPARSPFLTDVPTVTEAGGAELKSFDVTVWSGVFAPAAAPQSVVQRVNEAVNHQLRSSDFRARMAAQFIRADEPMAPADFAALVKADRERWTSLARSINLELQ